MTRHVIRKDLPLYQNRLCLNLTAGRPVRVGPYAQGQRPCIFYSQWTVIIFHRLAAIL